MLASSSRLFDHSVNGREGGRGGGNRVLEENQVVAERKVLKSAQNTHLSRMQLQKLEKKRPHLESKVTPTSRRSLLKMSNIYFNKKLLSGRVTECTGLSQERSHNRGTFIDKS